MKTDLIGKKRTKEEKQANKNKENDDDSVGNDNNEEEDFEELMKLFKVKNYGKDNYIRLPHKSLYRMRAHCNPLSDVSMKYPLCPSQVNWSLHFGKIIANNQELNITKYNNTKKYPLNYSDIKVNLPESTNKKVEQPCVNILDIGCGFGGLLFNMSPYLKENDLALGMEIRDKVTSYVTDRIQALRNNSDGEGASNISALRVNVMKTILHYFFKGQIEKMLFCFADPHFKKYTHRRRIINKYLLQDYAYLLKEGGIIYSITDVEDLHNWHVSTVTSFPCFQRISNEELEQDPFLQYMKNTDEARKVIRNKGSMYYAAWKRVKAKINNFSDLLSIVKKNNKVVDDDGDDEEK